MPRPPIIKMASQRGQPTISVEEIVQEFFSDMKKELNIKRIADVLYSKRLIDHYLKKKIDREAIQDEDANELFLDHLIRNGTLETLRRFCEVLEETAESRLLPHHRAWSNKLKQKLTKHTMYSSDSTQQPPQNDSSPRKQVSKAAVVQHISGASLSVHDIREPSSMDNNCKTPSDVGLRKVAMKIGSCDLLAVELGIPLTHIYSLPNSPLKGVRTLAYWRDGRCDSSFPTTWGFLLEKVEGACGRTVAEELRETLSKDPACVLRSESESSV